MTVKYSPNIGHITGCAKLAIELAKLADEVVEFTFNATTVRVYPTHEAQIVDLWDGRRAVCEPKST